VTRPSQYVELHCHSAFSLLDGAALPEQLVERAAELGYPALALTDHDELGGAVRFGEAATESGIKAIIGAELTVLGGPASRARLKSSAAPTAPIAGRSAESHHIVLLAQDRVGYGNLSTLITLARSKTRGEPCVDLDTLATHSAGLFALTGCPRGWVPTLAASGDVDAACDATATLLDIFDRRVAIECWDHGLPEERETSRHLIAVARALDIPWVVTNDVHYARARDRAVHDVLNCLKHKRTLDDMGTRLRPNGEWYLKSDAQMLRRWQHAPEGVRNTLAIAERCAFRMKDMKPTLPHFPLPPGVSADEYLERLVARGAEERWGKRPDGRRQASDVGRAAQHGKQLAHELGLIRKLGLAGFFLIVWDIVRFARRRGILCQGRGSAANSAVCFCLGITPVDPIKLNLLFERFLSEERSEAPDIDVDFAHEEREHVIQYVYDKYGRDHAAMVCEQITWKSRSAVRDAARVLGFSVQQADRLATLADRHSARETAAALRGEEAAIHGGSMRNKRSKRMDDGWESPITKPQQIGREAPAEHINPAAKPPAENSLLELAGLDSTDKRVALLAELVDGLHQLPRHRSIHVGGFVLTKEPLATVVPIEPASMKDRTVIQWEKDDLDPAGLVKIDLLGLGMLTMIQKCITYVRQTRGVTVDLARLDMDDQAVYDDMCKADTIGVFQIESRAQMNTLPRLKPRKFYDLVVEVALIRPGPIQGDMVHPYLRRRAGEEEVTYPHPSLKPILERTLGVPLFQEQGMQVAIAAAGFTPGEADVLRKAMGHKRSHERMAAICQKLIDGMRRNGFSEELALRIYHQINAFADYGFPESHAASFALLVFASAYLKHYYAPEFTAALLNSQPMGFYAPGTIIEDAKRHGVVVRPIDIRRSGWDHALEERKSDIGNRKSNGKILGSSISDSRLSISPPAVRLGIRLVKGLGSKAHDIFDAARAAGPFTSIEDFVQRTGFDRRSLRHLAMAGAFDGFLNSEPDLRKRRAALWDVLDAARGDAGPLAPRNHNKSARSAAAGTERSEREHVNPAREASRPRTAQLPPMSPGELTEADYRMTGVSLNGHPMRHLRAVLAPNGVQTTAQIARARDGTRVAVAGLVICRQRPGTAKGFVFLTLEDEFGLVNVVITPKRFERQALLISQTPLLLVRGVLQIEQTVVNVRAEYFRGLQADVGAEFARSHDFH
jgi:error-prone DNA polymerase